MNDNFQTSLPDDTQALQSSVQQPSIEIQQEQAPDESTLGESVVDSLMRDIKSIGTNLLGILCPSKSNSKKHHLQNWDLWGPLAFSLIFGCCMTLQATSGESAVFFTIAFVVMWVGATAVSWNAKFIGGNLSIFQSVCLLGYCLCPYCVVAIAGAAVSLVNLAYVSFIVKSVLGLAAFIWSIIATVPFFSVIVPPKRVALGMFPVILFFFALTWFVIAV
ncbi:putative Yip1 domain containing protein [Monocercomonoides exilis]|uniref:putative Yip1 domain containing protein n=1 Tax=Monocercomonoides exilis TaxID=2049356 RepID=UPI003559786B|nr:putative Yip1 domain containing protein [Monocercomonoides exilis]|eukprot:MONOS_778.1-p1 / transcript=MONOS_778.1 / gene=MONOS_778 / organism=Monocercomonoides_exilis_PA203 / gene_product=Yip1 domain containing protein / transcript_product=Yip1 domain containing protein / location=Mono_scaffold00013:78958-79861(+) / protein_length=218 / sequence_SO=supercontig / SO=protein_coding / is_pseudo=false